MKNFSQTFVSYHSCGKCYLDGTNTLVPIGRKCVMQTNNPFWKNPIDTNSKIAKPTRTQLKIKARANRSYGIKYLRFKKASEENKFGDESDYSTGDESNGYNSNKESISGNATETEQNLTDDELTGENLIIDENTDNNHIHEHSLMGSCTSKNYEQTLNNKETNSKILPDVI